MRILAVTYYYYYNNPRGLEPQFYYLFRVPQQMGYEVDFFDYATSQRIGLDHMRRQFLTLLRGGKYDVVFIATHQDEFDIETLNLARAFCPVIGWNSDDEWRWESYSSRYIPAYTYMVTNSPAVFSREKKNHSNLLHAQWACTGFWDGGDTRKDIDFSFVGQVYGVRKAQINLLIQRTQLRAFGKGSGQLAPDFRTASSAKEKLREFLRPWVARLAPTAIDDTISFEEVNALWNRSKISFTPLDSSDLSVRQIKSRVFDMGLSGTLMLAHSAPHLNDYYEPDLEYVPFETMEECIDKARFFLVHEDQRKKIARAYAKRTLNQHMWKHRITHVLKEAGLQ